MSRVTNSNPMSLANVGRGKVIERFDLAVADVLENIRDESTPTGKPRKVIIEATFLPSSDRDGADISISVVPKLPAAEPYVSQLIITQDSDGNVIANESMSVEDADGVGEEYSEI